MGTIVDTSKWGVTTMTLLSCSKHYHSLCKTFWRNQIIAIASFGNQNYSTRPIPKDYYQTLGVSQNAKQSQIKAAYYKLSKKYHPDLNKDPDAEQQFAAISAAYECLGNKTSRRAYDGGFYNPGASHI